VADTTLMPDWLDRELTEPEQTVREKLLHLVRTRTKSEDVTTAVGPLAAGFPGAFFVAALSLLGSTTDPAVRRSIFDAVADRPEFWSELLAAGRFSRPELLEVGRYLMTIEGLMDVRLVRLFPGRSMRDSKLSPEAVLRGLDLLDQLSPGSRLILLVNHLTQHADQRIASKATILVGRRLRNQDWVSQHLDCADGRVRASTVEGLWGVQSPSARRELWACLRDKNNRVVGNALIGLHRLGEPRVNEFVKGMIEDERPPFRWTAAWAMGQIGADEFVEYLDRALQDKEPHVRRAAERALDAIRLRQRESNHAVTESSNETPDPVSSSPEPPAGSRSEA
jgi:hypothetical protein